MLSQSQSTVDPSLTRPGSLFGESSPSSCRSLLTSEGLTSNTPPYRIPPPLPPPTAVSQQPPQLSDSDTDTEPSVNARSCSSASDAFDDLSEADSVSSDDRSYTSASDFDEPPEPAVLTHPLYVAPLGVRFTSRAALLADIQSFAKRHAFGVTIARSNNKRVGYEYMALKCAHGGNPGTHRKAYSEQRKTRTVWARQKQCPFYIYTRNHGGKDLYDVGLEQDWRVDTVTQCNEHNHPPSRPIDLAIHRKASMNPAALAFIIGQIEHRNRPRKIEANTRNEFPDLLITRKDIYNITFRHRWRERQGHTPTEAIIRRLQDDGELARAFVDDRRRCIGLLYTTKEARALTHRFPTVLFIDTTFQTNRFGLPMLHIGGFTATNHSFSSAVVFMVMQTTEWYELAIKAYLDFVQLGSEAIKVVITDRERAIRNALHTVLPSAYQLLCQWHLSENIRGNTDKYFKRIARRKAGYDIVVQSHSFRDSWQAHVVQAKTKADMWAGLDKIRASFPEPELEKAHRYLRKLLGNRKHFVAAYIDRHEHLGQRTTSRIEGTHKGLKDYLDSHTDDLYEVIRGLRSFFKDQWQARLLDFGTQREISDISVGRPFLLVSRLTGGLCTKADLQVKGRVSRKAIELVKKQLALADKHIAAAIRGHPIPPCTHHFSRSFGLPCSHTLEPLVIEDKPIPMRLFHHHWRLPTERELTDWMEQAEDRVAGSLQPADTTETVLPPSYTFEDLDQEDIILDPPHRPRKRGRRRRPTQRRARGRTDNGGGGGGDGGGGVEQDLDNDENDPADNEPEQHASGRWVGRHERQAGPARPRQNQCSACGGRGHNRRSKDCTVRRQENARNENARDERARNARNERRPLQESQAIANDRHTATFEQSAAETAGNAHSLPGTDAQSLSNVDSGSILGGSGHGQFDGLDRWTGGQEGNPFDDSQVTVSGMQGWETSQMSASYVL